MKKIILCVVLAICAVGANAQEMSPEEVAKLKKEMNEIKLSEDFVFAEGFAEYLSDDGDKAVSQATQQSMMKLQAHVVKIFAEQLNMSKEDVQEIWDTIEDKCQNVEITASGVSRTFLYISKEVIAGIMPDINLFPNRKKKTEQQAAEFLGTASVTTPTSVVQPEVAKTESVVAPAEPVVAQVVEAKKEEQVAQVEQKVAVVEEKVEAEAKSTEVQTQVVVQTKTTQVAVVTQTVEEAKQEAISAKSEPAVVETPKEEAPVTPVVETPAPAPTTVKVSVPALCQTMLDKKNFETLRRFLDEEKAYEKLIYGPESRMARAAQCYIVIIDKATKNIVTILDKGISDRMNFVTGKMDSFSTYQMAGGYMAIFVQEM